MTRKQRQMFAEARRTQKMLVGESVEYKPAASASDVPTTDAVVEVDPYAYIRELEDHKGNGEAEEIDMQALFDDVEQKMRDNTEDNEEYIEEEV